MNEGSRSGSAPLIKAHELTKTFDVRRTSGRLRRTREQVHAVREVSFEIGRGEMVGYIGPNGAGKSTTIKMMTGILVPSSGTIEVAGLDPSRSRTTLARRLGVVFGQRTSLWWDLPLGDTFDLLRKLYRVEEPRYRRNLQNYVELLDLADLLATPVRQLSLGQRMRGDIVAALLHDPEILFLDEPTIGMDVVSKATLRDFLGRLNAERGVTVVLTTHDLGDIEALCERVLVIDHGGLVFDGSLPDLHTRGGGERMLSVDLATEQPPLQLPGSRVVRVEGPRQWLAFPVGSSAAALIGALVATTEVVDLRVQEPDIEEVIKALYAEPPGDR